MHNMADQPPKAPRQPKINAMLICERVIRETGSGLMSLIGIFEDINARQFPVVIPRLFVYAKMTEAQGEYRFRLELVRRNDFKVIGETTLDPVGTDDPMAHNEVVFELLNVPIEQPGYYDFRLFANGTEMFLDSKSLQANQVQSQEEAGGV